MKRKVSHSKSKKSKMEDIQDNGKASIGQKCGSCNVRFGLDSISIACKYCGNRLCSDTCWIEHCSIVHPGKTT